jgi:hypothetical protein
VTSAIYADLVARLRLKQNEERRFLIRTREELTALRREITVIKKLVSEIRGGRLDENDASSRHRDLCGRLTVAETRFIRLEASLLAEVGEPRKPARPVGTRPSLTPVQATEVPQRDEKRRNRIIDLQASKRKQVATKDRQIADVRARLGR